MLFWPLRAGMVTAARPITPMKLVVVVAAKQTPFKDLAEVAAQVPPLKLVVARKANSPSNLVSLAKGPEALSLRTFLVSLDQIAWVVDNKAHGDLTRHIRAK